MSRASRRVIQFACFVYLRLSAPSLLTLKDVSPFRIMSLFHRREMAQRKQRVPRTFRRSIIAKDTTRRISRDRITRIAGAPRRFAFFPFAISRYSPRWRFTPSNFFIPAKRSEKLRAAGYSSRKSSFSRWIRANEQFPWPRIVGRDL